MYLKIRGLKHLDVFKKLFRINDNTSTLIYKFECDIDPGKRSSPFFVYYIQSFELENILSDIKNDLNPYYQLIIEEETTTNVVRIIDVERTEVICSENRYTKFDNCYILKNISS